MCQLKMYECFAGRDFVGPGTQKKFQQRAEDLCEDNNVSNVIQRMTPRTNISS